MIDKMILTVFSWILAAFLAAQLLLLSMPLFRRLEYDAICHKHMMLMDYQGGLTSDGAAGLLYELEDRGFVVDQVSGTASADFGDELSLHVTSHDKNSRIQPDLSRKEVVISYIYQSSMICRKLKNYAVAP